MLTKQKMQIGSKDFLKMGHPRPLFVYIRCFQTQILHKTTVGFSGIRTRICGEKSAHSDRLTTTTAAKIIVSKFGMLTNDISSTYNKTTSKLTKQLLPILTIPTAY